MSKRLIITLSILFGSLLIGWILWKNPNSTNQIAQDAFALKNPNQVTSITLSPNDPKQPFLILEKVDNVWYVKNKSERFVADTNNIHHLLYNVSAKLQVKNPVSNKALKHVTRFIATRGIKVIFKSGDEEHTLFVGPPTTNEMATYMYLPNTELPCEIVVPGFTGYLTPNFTNNIQAWRAPDLVNEDPSNIAKLTFNYTNYPEKSFSIESQKDHFNLLNHANQVQNGNQALLSGYLELAKNITREVGDIPAINNNKRMKDSLLNFPPLFTIRYELKNPSATTTANPNFKGNKKEIILSFYPIPNGEEEIQMQVVPNEARTLTTQLFWVKSSLDNTIWTVQELILKNRIKTIQDFQR